MEKNNKKIELVLEPEGVEDMRQVDL